MCNVSCGLGNSPFIVDEEDSSGRLYAYILIFNHFRLAWMSMMSVKSSMNTGTERIGSA